ncbi:MAG: calcium-binding protein, partial [Alphaproteobacteria bacterium]
MTLLQGVPNDATLTGDRNSDPFYGNAGNGNDWTSQTRYNSESRGGRGDDTLYGSGGDDYIYDNGGNDVIYAGAGDDDISADGGGDTLYGGDGNDWVSATTYYTTVPGDQLHSYLSGGAGDDVLESANSADTLLGGTGNDTIYGSSGNDTMDGGADNDELRMAGGNDLVTGGTGADTFVVLSNWAADTITDFDTSADLIDLTSHDARYVDLVFTQSGANTIITFGTGVGSTTGGDSGSLTLLNTTASSLSADHFYLQENQPVSRTGTDDADTLSGTAFDDTLYGQGGDDSLDAGNGDDDVYGGAGNDYAGLGRGNDTYYDPSGADTVVAGSGADRIDLGDGNDLVYAGGGADSITASGSNSSLYGESGDDVIYSLSSVGGDTLQHNYVSGGAGNDVLVSGDSSDTLEGGDDNDSLYGNWGDDSLAGGDGNDVLSGHNGDDTTDGGAGDDELWLRIGADLAIGGSGSDTFFVRESWGHDTITDFDPNEDVIDLSVHDVQYRDLVFTQSGADTVITFGAGAGSTTGGASGSLTLLDTDAGSLSSSHFVMTVDGVVSRTGTDGADTIIGGSFNDTLDGAGGNDSLVGGGGYDSLVGGDGNDILTQDRGSASGGNGDDLITFEGTSGSNWSYGYGGSGNDTIYAHNTTSNLYGHDGNDVLVGSNVGTYYAELDGGAGDDMLQTGNASRMFVTTGTGDDTLAVTWNDGLTGHQAYLYSLSGTGNTLDLSAVADSLDDIRIYGTYHGTIVKVLDDEGRTIGTIEFDQSEYHGFSELIVGDTSYDLLLTENGDEIYSGLLLGATEGDDTLTTDGFGTAHGLGGNDHITDSFDLSWVYGDAGDDTIIGSGIASTLIGGDGNDSLVAEGDSPWLVGGNGDDTLVARYSSDYLGNDYDENMAGGAGDDFYVVDTEPGVQFELSIGFGSHSGEDFTGTDTLDLSRITTDLSDIRLSGYSLGFKIEILDDEGNTTGVVTVGSFFFFAGDDYSIVDRLMIGDTTYDIGAFTSLTEMYSSLYYNADASDNAIVVTGDGESVGGLAGDDTITSDALGVTLEGDHYGIDGNDYLSTTGYGSNLWGDGGDDTLIASGDSSRLNGGGNAGGGDDLLISSGRNNRLEGGEGNDTLIASGEGAKLYGDDYWYEQYSDDDNLFASGARSFLDGGGGNDTVEGASGSDTLIGGDGFDIVAFTRAGAGVMVDLVNQTVSGGASVGDMSGFEGAIGSDFSDTLQGDIGINAFYGAAGDDLLIGGLGADTLNGGAGSDTASFETASAAVSANLVSGRGTGGEADGDVYISIENLTGSNHDDSLIGNRFANVLAGGAGDDTLVAGYGYDSLSGGDGDDYLKGGYGIDTLEGGAGADTLDGEQDNDWVSYAGSDAGVSLTLLGNGWATGTGGDAEGDRVANVQRIVGSEHNDSLGGNS